MTAAKQDRTFEWEYSGWIVRLLVVIAVAGLMTFITRATQAEFHAIGSRLLELIR